MYQEEYYLCDIAAFGPRLQGFLKYIHESLDIKHSVQLSA